MTPSSYESNKSLLMPDPKLGSTNVTVHVVQTGHAMSKEQIGRAVLHKSPYKSDQRCKEAEMPPYNSEQFYDSKLWSFLKKHGKPGALAWNVA